MSFLMSPVVSLLVGQSGDENVLTAHQALLQKSPYFKDACTAFDDDTVRFPLPASTLYAPCAGLTTTDCVLAPPHRPRRREPRRHRLLPRIPLHRRLLPQEAPRPAQPGDGPLPPDGRRRRRPAPPARARLHTGQQVRAPRAQDAGELQDPLRQLDGQGRDCVRAVRVRAHDDRGQGRAGARLAVLGHAVARAAERGGGGVQGVVPGVPAVRVRRAQLSFPLVQWVSAIASRARIVPRGRLVTRVIWGYGNRKLTGDSARARREAQARQPREDAAARGQRAQEAETEPRLRPSTPTSVSAQALGNLGTFFFFPPPLAVCTYYCSADFPGRCVMDGNVLGEGAGAGPLAPAGLRFQDAGGPGFLCFPCVSSKAGVGPNHIRVRSSPPWLAPRTIRLRPKSNASKHEPHARPRSAAPR